MPQLFLLHYITQCHFHFSGSKLARHMYVTNHVQITSLLTYKIIMPDQGRRDHGDRREIPPPPSLKQIDRHFYSYKGEGADSALRLLKARKFQNEYVKLKYAQTMDE